MIVGAVAAVVCWLALPQAAEQIWKYRETRYAAALIDEPYLHEDDYRWDVPPQFWTPAALSKLVERAYEDYKLTELRKSIDKHHANDPAFAEVVKQIDARLAQ